MKVFVMLFTLVVFSIYAKADPGWSNITETNTSLVEYKHNSLVTAKIKGELHHAAIIRFVNNTDVHIYTYVLKTKSCSDQLGVVQLYSAGNMNYIRDLDFVFNGGNVVSTVAEFMCGLGKLQREASL